MACENKPQARLAANAEYMRQAEEFIFSPLDVEVRSKVSMNERLLLLKKRLLFIKSKLSNPK